MPAVRDLILNLKERREGNAMLSAANDLDKLARGANASGDAFEQMRADAKRLDAQIVTTKAHVKDLYTQYARTGDKSLFGDIHKSERDLRMLERTLANIADTGTQVTNNFGKQISSAFSGAAGTPGLGPVVIGGLVEAAVLAAPTVGAMLAGGIAGAAGTGALAAGILSASKDERVRSAASEFGQRITDEFFGGGEAFVEPVINGLDKLQAGFEDIHVSDSLAKVADEVPVIAEGFADAARNFMPGFNKALDRMGPLADVAAHGIADLGDAAGDFFDQITASEGTVEGLEVLFRLFNGTIRVVGGSLEGLADAFHRGNVIAGGLAGDLEDVLHAVGLEEASRGAAHLNDQFERMTGTGENLHGVFSQLESIQAQENRGLDLFSAYANDAKRHMAELGDQTETTRKSLVDYFNTLQGQLDANIAWEQAIDDLTQSINENGTSLDIGTQKGRDNTRAVEEGLDAARRQYQQGQITQQQYNEEIQKLIDVGAKAGLARQQLEQLAKPYLINVTAVYSAVGSLSQITRNLRAEDRFTGRAVGGPVAPGGTYLIGERGPELLTMGNQSGYVHPSATAAPVVISFAATGDALLDALLRELKKYVRVNGGTGSDSVQVALGY